SIYPPVLVFDGYGHHLDLPSFPTRRSSDLVERQLARGLPEAEAAALWECLFLTLPEIGALLGHVRAHAAHGWVYPAVAFAAHTRSEEHTSELQSLTNLVCRLLLEKKKLTTT